MWLKFYVFLWVKKIASAISFSSERFIIIDSIFSRGCLPLWASKAIVWFCRNLFKTTWVLFFFFLSGFSLAILEFFLLEISHSHYPCIFVGTIMSLSLHVLNDLAAPRQSPFTSISRTFPKHHFHQHSTSSTYLSVPTLLGTGNREYCAKQVDLVLPFWAYHEVFLPPKVFHYFLQWVELSPPKDTSLLVE